MAEAPQPVLEPGPSKQSSNDAVESSIAKFKVSGTTHEKVYCSSHEFAKSYPLNGLEDCALFGITMYNEPPEFLEMTLEACLKQMPRFDASGTRVATAIFLDGVDKIHPETVTLLQDMGLLLPSKPPANADEEPPEAYFSRGILQTGPHSMGIMLLIKQENGGKISSHDWLFNGICFAIQPFSVHIIDCGTIPLEGALFNQFHTMKTCDSVVLVSSNILARLDQWWNPIQQLQVAEFLGGASLFGLNTLLGVLHPTSGPCCSFRWKAMISGCSTLELDPEKGRSSSFLGSFWKSFLVGKDPSPEEKESLPNNKTEHSTHPCSSSLSSDPSVNPSSSLATIPCAPGSISKKQVIRPKDNVCPLDVYSYSRDNELGVFESNVYMVEDTLLGTEMARVGVVCWMPDVVGTFDAPTELVALLKQRKRWFNGGFCVLLWQLYRCWNLFLSPETGKSLTRRFAIGLQMLWLSYYWLYVNFLGYGTLVLIQCYVAELCIEANEGGDSSSNWVLSMAETWKWLLAAIFACQVSLGVFFRNPTDPIPKVLYYIVLGAQMFTQVGVAILWTHAISIDKYIHYFGVAATVSILSNAFIYTIIRWPRQLIKLVLCLPALFIVGIPFFVSVPVRGFANLHDVSWGTKGLDDSPETARNKWSLLAWRFLPITLYAVANVAAVIGFQDSPRNFFLSMLLPILVAWTVGTIVFVCLTFWCSRKRPKFD